MIQKDIPEGLTFEDVLLLPAYSQVAPTQVDVSTRVTRTRRLYVPVVSAAMDTVTEARTAITMAQEGGIGFLHKNLAIAEQVAARISVEALGGVNELPINIVE